MDRKQATTTLFLLVLAAIALYFCYLIARPFLSPIFLALMIAIVFHDRGLMMNRTASVLPLKPDQVKRLYSGISNSIVANVYGCLAVGAAHGSLAGLAFWVLGLPSPVLWGLVTALFSLIPLIGSAAVWGPAVIILLSSGHWGKGLIMLGWGAAVISQVD